MTDNIMDTQGVAIKWIALAVMVVALAVAAAESFDSKYKAEAVASAAESWSKIMIACIAAEEDDCSEKYRMVIK